MNLAMVMANLHSIGGAQICFLIAAILAFIAALISPVRLGVGNIHLGWLAVGLVALGLLLL